MTASQERIVLTYGTFDLFHAGHVRLLQRASELGSKVIVGLSTDDFNALKGKEAVMSYEDRKCILEACRFVDEVFPENHWEQKTFDAQRLGADVFVMGDDWTGKFDFMSGHCDVVYLSRTPEVSTTLLKTKITSWLNTEKQTTLAS